MNWGEILVCRSGEVAAASSRRIREQDAPATNRSSKLSLVAFLFDLPFGGFLLGGFLFGRCAGSRSRAGRNGFAFPRLLFFLRLLHFLDDDPDDFHFGQSERTAAFLPALLGHEGFDSFTARQHATGALESISAAKTFIDRHDSSSFVSFVLAHWRKL